MKRVPTESCHIPQGLLTEAEEAISPSPKEEATPVPATVSIRYDGATADTWTQEAMAERKITLMERDEAKPTRKNIFVDDLWN
jgi:hypothetical protein